MTPYEAVVRHVTQNPQVQNYLVAYSGGLDSHVLLALMAKVRDENPHLKVRAVHVNHGLQSDSDNWAVHARKVCSNLDIPLEVRQCNVDQSEGGPEAAARRARYRQFDEVMQKNEHLLLAQHAEDQAETFLLQALRGSGPDGLSGIPGKRAFGRGIMARPLLGCSQESLQSTALKLGLNWIEDPSNLQTQFDRNYLRLQIMPLIKARWPAATQTLGRSAMRSAAASKSLRSMAQQDLDSVKVEGKPELSLSGLKRLPRERAYMAIRLWVRQRSLPLPRLQDLQQVHLNLISARPESSGVVRVGNYEFRRYRDSLYLLGLQGEQTPFRYTWSAPFDDLFIAETGATLTLEACVRQGIRMPEEGSVTVKNRAGGELIRVGRPAYHKAVKKILQESSIEPWQRASIPLVYINQTLAAVWQLQVCVDHRSKTATGKVVSAAKAANKTQSKLVDDVGA